MLTHVLAPRSRPAVGERSSPKRHQATTHCAAWALGGCAIMLITRTLLGHALPRDTALCNGAFETWCMWVSVDFTLWTTLIVTTLPRLRRHAREQALAECVGALVGVILLSVPFLVVPYFSVGVDYRAVNEVVQRSTNDVGNWISLIGCAVGLLPTAVMFAATQQMDADAMSALPVAERARRYRDLFIETQRVFRMVSTMFVLATLTTYALWKALSQAGRLDARADGLAELYVLQLTAGLCLVYIPIYIRQHRVGTRLAQELGIEGSREALARQLGISGADAIEALATALAPLLAAAVSGHV